MEEGKQGERREHRCDRRNPEHLDRKPRHQVRFVRPARQSLLPSARLVEEKAGACGNKYRITPKGKREIGWKDEED
jgi:hypothetical protein